MDIKKVRKNVQRDVRHTERPNLCNSKVDVAEKYSPFRMCATARKLGLKAGFSFDLTANDENNEPWNVSIECPAEGFAKAGRGEALASHGVAAVRRLHLQKAGG